MPHWFRKQWALCLLKVRYTSALHPATTHSMNRRDHWTFCHVRQGSLSVRTFCYEIAVPSGHAVVLPPLRHGEIGPTQKACPVTGLVSGFDVQVFLEAGNPLTRLGLPAVVPMPPGPELDGWCDRLRASTLRRKGIFVDESAALAARVWLDLLLFTYLQVGFDRKIFTGSASGPVPEWIQALADHLARKSPTQELRPCGLHRLSGFSRSHVSAEFKKHLGETPRRYLHRKRVEMAIQKLTSNPEMSIGEIAMQCGYSSQSLFNRRFRQLTGRTPGQFRHSQNKT